MTEKEIVQAVDVAFEYSYMHDDWVTPLDEALEGLSADEASRSPKPGAKSIWEIVLHLAVWNENIVARVKTRAVSRPEEGAWPPLPANASEDAWQQAQSRLRQSLLSVRDLLQSTTLEQIQASPYGLADVLCRLTHNGYHIGQFVKIRELT